MGWKIRVRNAGQLVDEIRVESEEAGIEECRRLQTDPGELEGGDTLELIEE